MLEYPEQRDHVGRFCTTNRARAVGGGQYPAVGTYNELRRLNDTTIGLPPRADRIRNVSRNAERKRECKAELVGQRPRLCFRIHTGRNDPRAESLELIQLALQAGQLPATEGSPMAAVEENDPVPCIQIGGKPQRFPPDNRQRQHRENISGIQNGFHASLPYQAGFSDAYNQAPTFTGHPFRTMQARARKKLVTKQAAPMTIEA